MLSIKQQVCEALRAHSYFAHGTQHSNLGVVCLVMWVCAAKALMSGTPLPSTFLSLWEQVMCNKRMRRSNNCQGSGNQAPGPPFVVQHMFPKLIQILVKSPTAACLGVDTASLMCNKSSLSPSTSSLCVVAPPTNCLTQQKRKAQDLNNKKDKKDKKDNIADNIVDDTKSSCQHDYREARNGRDVCVKCGDVAKGAKLMPEAYVEDGMVSSSTLDEQAIEAAMRRLKTLRPEHKLRHAQTCVPPWVASLKMFHSAVATLSAKVSTQKAKGKPSGFPVHQVRTQEYVQLLTPPALKQLYDQAFMALAANAHKLIASNLSTVVLVCYATYVASNAGQAGNLAIDDPYGSTFGLAPFVGVVALKSNTLWKFGDFNKAQKVPMFNHLGVAQKCIVADALCSTEVNAMKVLSTTRMDKSLQQETIMHNIAVKCMQKQDDNNTKVVRGQIFIADTTKPSYNASWHVHVEVLTTVHLNMFAKSLSAMRRGVLLTRLDNTAKEKHFKIHKRQEEVRMPALHLPPSSQSHDAKHLVPGACIQATFVVNGWEPNDTIDIFVDNVRLSSVGLSGSQDVLTSKLVTAHRAFKITASMPPVEVQVMEYDAVTRVY